MSLWTFYLIGVVVALAWATYDYYFYNVKLGKDVRYIFTNLDDIKSMFLFSLGSWLAVIMLIFKNDD